MLQYIRLDYSILYLYRNCPTSLIELAGARVLGCLARLGWLDLAARSASRLLEWPARPVFRAYLIDLGSIWDDLGSTWDDLGSILVHLSSILDLQKLEFEVFSKRLRSCWPTRSKNRRFQENLQKPKENL